MSTAVAPAERPIVSLDEFAPRTTSTCGACNLPSELRDEVERCRLSNPKRFTYPIISEWLVKSSIDIHPDALRRHFNRHVRTTSRTED